MLTKSLLNKLECKARINLASHMVGIGGVIGCPWLRWWINQNFCAPPKTILIMQDWGVATCVENNMNAAVQTVEDALNGFSYGDRTMKKLFSVPEVRRAVRNGRLLITNAVWGVRKSGGKCSRLKDSAHRAAYPIWRQLVDTCAQPNFLLITCGGWSKCSNLPDNTLNAYLQRWSAWAGPSLTKSFTPGRYLYLPHPSSTIRWKIPALILLIL
jgi:hypothetical protein